MPLIDSLLALGPIRKAIWRWWYPFLTRRLKQEDILFLNYAFETDPPLGLPLEPEDEANRACLQLYHHVATQGKIANQRVLEVSCGHGGGASYITRKLHPAHYTGLDLNPAGIEFCRKRHVISNLEFTVGDAQSLPFPDASFDVVINVEASHCYPDFPRFLRQVDRILRPGGQFLYADFRFTDSIPPWEQALDECPLILQNTRVINAEVLRGLDANAGRSTALVERKLPKLLQALGRDFAGLPGSRIYKALLSGEMSYRSYAFLKE